MFWGLGGLPGEMCAEEERGQEGMPAVVVGSVTLTRDTAAINYYGADITAITCGTMMINFLVVPPIPNRPGKPPRIRSSFL